MNNYKYTISFNAFKDFEINANSPEESNEILQARVGEFTKSLRGSVDLNDPHGHVLPKECKDGFPYGY